MKVQAMKRLTAKTNEGTIEIPEGAVIDIPRESADALIREKKVQSLAQVFERLFHGHAQRMREHVPTMNDIEALLPARAEEIRVAVRALDDAWYKEDLQGFVLSMKRLEAVYALSCTELRQAGNSCTKYPAPAGPCRAYTMRLDHDTRELRPWCKERQTWCPSGAVREGSHEE